MTILRRAFFVAALICGTPAFAAAQANPDKLLWGDTHLHTNLSVDAYFLANRSADADTAYRFAKGEPVVHPYHRAKMQLRTPLDFLAVTDHGEMIGVPYRMLTLNDERLASTRLGSRLVALVREGRHEDAFGLFLLAINMAGASEEGGPPPKVGALKALWWRLLGLFSVQDQGAQVGAWLAGDRGLLQELAQEDVMRTSWHVNVDAAERHNRPGAFTTLIGWEYTPTPDGANLHRVVLTPADGAAAKTFMPFNANLGPHPEDLWAWMKETSERTGFDFVAIPHNSNISKGRMFASVDSEGRPITAGYARERALWEPVAEVTQIKGTSETHPLLSPDDEFAGFEFFNRLIDARANAETEPTVTEADYLRGALRTGLEIEAEIGVNPFKFGMIGATDSHSGLASAEEDNFTGKMAVDSIPENKSQGFGGVAGWEMSASGLAAVWARDNTREEIAAAFRRREVYGTTGPRIGLRFFGGYGFSPEDAAARDVASAGYAKGVPMGGDLTRAANDMAPSFLVRATKDPAGANLDRIQIVKGWLGANGQSEEKVFDVAWSGDRAPGANGKLPPVGDTVDRTTAAYANTIGAADLVVAWTDPEFDPAARAFYYARVLQIPTPRNSLYDSVALQRPHPDGYPAAIQERAYSSPIWYTP